jgi:ATP-binding cassette subfamily B protein
MLFRRLVHQARSYWPHLFLLLLINLLAAPLALLTPLPLKIAVDNVLGSHPLPWFLEPLLPGAATKSNALMLAVVAGLLVTIALLNQFQGLASSWLRAYTGEKLVLIFRAQLFRHAQHLSLSYHDSKGISDSAYRIQYDAPSIQWVLIDGIIPFITAGFTLLGMIYVTAKLNLQLALVALAVSPMLFLVSWSYSPRLRNTWREVKNLESFSASVVQEVLTAVRVVKAFAQEDREQKRFVNHANDSVSARLRVVFVEGQFNVLVGLITAVGTAVGFVIGIRYVQLGTLTLGELLVVLAYLSQLYGPLLSISKMIISLQASLASAERAFSLLEEEPDVVERKDAKALHAASGALRFDSVSFAYDRAHPVLTDISLEINPGSCVGVIGMTGAGKTTLLSLLMRFYDPTVGGILLDGVDLRDYKVADLRNQYAMVLQDSVLFSTSIAENIRYAHPEAHASDIIDAAKAANAHEFIIKLPQGYETQLGERGARLSGGERQRIALARAFLKDAPMLILDEPTSSVDMKTEGAILEAMQRLIVGRTTFIISHRLHILKNCTVLLVIQHGRLAHLTSDVTAALVDHGKQSVSGHWPRSMSTIASS